MAVAIKLSRKGKPKNPFYRVVVANKRSKRDGKFLENVGTYDPRKDDGLQLKMDRVQYWLERGAQPTDTVHQLIKRAPAAPAVLAK